MQVLLPSVPELLLPEPVRVLLPSVPELLLLRELRRRWFLLLLRRRYFHSL
jgi:hypothetical protein